MVHDSELVNKRVVIVGGSIAGCAMAVLLQRLGIDIILLERSANLSSQGAGITLPVDIINQCIELDLFDENIPRYAVSGRTFFRKDCNAKDEKTSFWEQSISAVTLNWVHIYQNLFKRVNPCNYHPNTLIRSIKKSGPYYKISTGTKTYQAEFLIAADGIDSTIRQNLAPYNQPHYAGYVAWRGLVHENSADLILFDKHIPYFLFDSGHLLLYRIPAKDFHQTGKSILNWVMYENKPSLNLEQFLIDKNGAPHTRSLPIGSLTNQHIQELLNLCRTVLPKQIAKIIKQTSNPFLQVVFDSQSPTYNDNHVIFTGDAAVTLRPHTASGVLKALLNAISFRKSIIENQCSSFEGIVALWQSEQQLVTSDEIIKAKSMGEALVSNPPNWQLMNQELMCDWWKSVMQGKNWYATIEKDT